MAVEAVLFDIGGVLIDWHPDRVYAALIPDPDERRRFVEETFTPEWIAAWDAGLPIDEACAALVAEHPQHEELISAWRRQDEMVAAIDGTAEVVEALADAGVRLFLLTNMPADVFQARLQAFEVLRRFDGAVVSGEEGVVKPDAAIFDIAMRRFQLAPTTTLFVDDSVANLSTAQRLGFHVHHFTGVDGLRAAVHELAGIPVGCSTTT